MAAAAIPYILAGTSVAQLKQGHDARKDAKKEKKKQEAESEKLRIDEQTEKFAAKRQEYSKNRDVLSRGSKRGRMSTILDKSDTLG